MPTAELPLAQLFRAVRLINFVRRVAPVYFAVSERAIEILINYRINWRRIASATSAICKGPITVSSVTKKRLKKALGSLCFLQSENLQTVGKHPAHSLPYGVAIPFLDVICNHVENRKN